MMAKILITTALLTETLFPGKHDVKITGARYDLKTGHVELEISGPSVPDAERVSATTYDPPRTEFKALSPISSKSKDPQ